jgi:lipid A disaccharide synthetase
VVSLPNLIYKTGCAELIQKDANAHEIAKNLLNILEHDIIETTW